MLDIEKNWSLAIKSMFVFVEISPQQNKLVFPVIEAASQLRKATPEENASEARVKADQ